MINDFLMLDIDSIDSSEKKHLLALFEKAKNTEFPSILDQLRGEFPPRKEIDRKLLQLIGYSSREADQFLEYLYPALANEIEKLKALLEG